jgi:hypothetical protein
MAHTLYNYRDRHWRITDSRGHVSSCWIMIYRGLTYLAVERTCAQKVEVRRYQVREWTSARTVRATWIE